MKLPNKILLLLIVAGIMITGIIFVLHRAENSGGKLSPQPAAPAAAAETLPGMELPEITTGDQVELPRLSAWQDNEFDLAAEQSSLAADMKKCAAGMLRAVLPEKSLISNDMEIALLSSNSALVSGKAVIPGHARQQEQILHYTIKVNFYANITCEAEFPKFVRSAER